MHVLIIPLGGENNIFYLVFKVCYDCYDEEVLDYHVEIFLLNQFF